MATVMGTTVREVLAPVETPAHWSPLPYVDVADLIQPYPERPRGFDKEYLQSLPSRWAGFAAAFRAVSDEAGQYS